MVENQGVRTDEQNTNKTEDLSIKLVSEISGCLNYKIVIINLLSGLFAS